MITRETTKRLISTAGIIVAAVIIIGYSYFAAYGLIKGPDIVMTNPVQPAQENGEHTLYTEAGTSMVVIAGNAARVNSLTFNGRAIAVDPEGNFFQTVLLSQGYNTETLVGQDKFGRTTQVSFEIYL